MLTQQERIFIMQNKETLMQIAKKYLEFYKNIIWREKDPIKKQENSAIADRIYDLISTINNLKIDKNKSDNKFTGV